MNCSGDRGMGDLDRRRLVLQRRDKRWVSFNNYRTLLFQAASSLLESEQPVACFLQVTGALLQLNNF